MHTENRIEPIEKPRGLFTRLAYWMIRRQFGKVIMPAKVIYARYPSLFFWVKKMSDIEEKQIPLDKELKLLVKYYVAYLNGCAFCLDIGEKLARAKKISTDKFYKVDQFRTHSLFSERERAALQFAEESNAKHVEDQTFANLKAHFNDKEIVGLAFIVATENYYNVMNHALDIGSDQLCAIQ
jgi:AhpD family alkylhydroperoxidase